MVRQTHFKVTQKIQKLKIYTKTGDKGQTSLYGGKRVWKTNLRIEAYGSIDELNSFLGVIISKIKNKKIKNELIEIQSDLFLIGSVLADPKNPKIKLKEKIFQIEKEIDKFSAKLPQIHNFILPGGGEVGSLLHFARTVTRRAERIIISLLDKDITSPRLRGAGKIDEEIIVYLNRLSDYLFILARFENKLEKKKEIIWKR